MFSYSPVESLSKLEILHERGKAKQYWKFLKTLREVWNGYGNRASWLIESYAMYKYQKDMLETLKKSVDLADLKLAQIMDEMAKVDAYMSSCAVALGECNTAFHEHVAAVIDEASQ